MADDRIVRLSLDSHAFDTSLQQSLNQVQQFELQIEKISKGVKGNLKEMWSPTKLAKDAFLSMAQPIKVAEAALQVFNKTVNSTKSTSQGFNTVMNQSEAAVNSFFLLLWQKVTWGLSSKMLSRSLVRRK